MSIDHVNAKNVWFTIEGSADGLKNVVVVETNLHVDARHPDYDDQAMTSLLEAVQRFLAQNKDHFDEMRIVPVRNWVGDAQRPLRREQL
jgi:hypothetical protein